MTSPRPAGGGRAEQPRSRRPAHVSLAYRPAIDGLRAIAVVAVIAYHALERQGLARFAPGGWLGVDVFFVISGFLITSLLLSEHRRWGSINLLGFWIARAKRLLPALFLVLTAVLTLGMVLTMPERRGALGGDVLAALFYVANWRFLLGDDAYFGSILAPSPLRHMWSLAVEEQYYLFYPLLVTALLAWLRHRRTALAGALGTLTLASAAWMALLHDPMSDPSRVYYGTDTRAFELLAGSTMAALISPGPGSLPAMARQRIDRVARPAALPILLVTLLLFVTAGEQDAWLFRGGLLLLCAALSLVLVAAASRSSSPAQRVLAWEPLRRVGLVSYGLYLWHWPIMVFLNRSVLDAPPAALIALQLLLTAAAAYLSYRFVENPVRRRGPRALVPRFPRVGTVVAGLAVPVLVAWSIALPRVGRATAQPTGSELTYTAPEYVPLTETVTAFFVGNSVPEGLYDKYPGSDYPDLWMAASTNVGCDTLNATKLLNGQEERVTPACAQWHRDLPTRMREAKPGAVVLWLAESMLSDHLDGDRRVSFATKEYASWLGERLDETHEQAKDAGARRFAIVNLACHQHPDFGGNDEVERANDPRAVGWLNDTVAAWAEKNDVTVIDQHAFLCRDGYSDTINGQPLYEDTYHFTAQSAPVVWSWLAPQLQALAAGRDPAGD